MSIAYGSGVKLYYRDANNAVVALRHCELMQLECSRDLVNKRDISNPWSESATASGVASMLLQVRVRAEVEDGSEHYFRNCCLDGQAFDCTIQLSESVSYNGAFTVPRYRHAIEAGEPQTYQLQLASNGPIVTVTS